MNYIVVIEKNAEKDIKIIVKSGNKIDIQKIKKMLSELSVSPYEGTGKPEALKHELSGYWSRRINKKDRLVYRVEEEVVTVVVISAIGHYSYD